MPHSVIERQPSPGSFDRRRRQTNLVCVPPGATARFQDEPVSPPMSKVGRIRNPHMRPEWRHWPVNERPVAVNSSPEKCGVFVIGWHDDPITLEEIDPARHLLYCRGGLHPTALRRHRTNWTSRKPETDFGNQLVAHHRLTMLEIANCARLSALFAVSRRIRIPLSPPYLVLSIS